MNPGFRCRPRRPRTLEVATFRASVGVFRAYESVEFSGIIKFTKADAKKLSRARTENLGTPAMDTNTLLIILVVIFLFGGFGFYGRGRWF